MASLTVYPQPGMGGANVASDTWMITTWASWPPTSVDTGWYDINKNYQYLQPITGGDGSNQYIIQRCFVNFDTSALTSSVTISAATMSFVGFNVNNNGTSNKQTQLVNASPTNAGDIATSDWTNIGTTAQSNSVLDPATLTLESYNDLVLNATGIASISKTGVSKFGLRNGYDINNISPDNINQYQGLAVYSADEAGTTKDPKLVITYTSGLTLALDTGAFTLTGNAVGLLRGFYMAISPGEFTLTGNAIGLIVSRVLSIATGVYNLTGQAISMVLGGWRNTTKSTTTWTNSTKSSTAWTNQTKSSTSWTNDTKHQ